MKEEYRFTREVKNICDKWSPKQNRITESAIQIVSYSKEKKKKNIFTTFRKTNKQKTKSSLH